MTVDIKQIDWVKFLERKRPLFIYYSFIVVETVSLEKVTGFGFKHSLYKYENGVGTHYRSQKELDACNVHFLSLVKNNDPRLVEWANWGMHWNKRADEIIAKYRTSQDIPFGENYSQFSNVLMYGVTIPYLVLSAIDESGVSHESQALFEKLRGVSKYPELEEVFLGYYWKIISEKYGISKELASTLTPDELDKALRGIKPNVEELEKRYTWCLMWNDRDYKFSYDKELAEEIQALKDEDVSGDRVSGQVAFRGNVRGTVCIVNDREDMRKFKEGDVLVSNATNPTLMSVISICSGIVTDEGGLMCHASIVSRELKKPCVVGTKVATKVFKDGDMVEVDADNGVVRKI